MAGGDREALARFYDAYAPLAFGLIRRLVGDPDEAADVLQDVFWELWRAAGEYDPSRGSPAAWVTVRARSRGIDRMRAARRRDEMLVPGTTEPLAAMADPRAEDPATAVSDRWAVRGALAALPDSQREVIELAYLGGLTQSEISLRLRQPLGTVKTRIRLGMERLRELMGAAR
jgi:RNA polymerase sigma-70 factor (ECF subfamily)